MVNPFSTQAKAIYWVTKQVDQLRRSDLKVQELTDDMVADGWAYYAAYSEENSVRVAKTTLDD